ncbi:inhibitor of prohead protease [Yersinia phage MHG19]|nr:inhibitor of prohead protease [Yersinia phage MHG19]
MIDKAYIEEIRQLDRKESKASLANYAKETFNIDLQKNRSFDNMVADLEKGLQTLASEPMPEDEGGMTIADLIQADDEMNGQSPFEEAKEEAVQLLIDSVDVAPEVVEVKADYTAEVVWEEPVINAPIIPDVELPEVVEPVADIKAETPDIIDLPENFNPTMILFGRAPGYCTLPWWIYQWITENPDWKARPYDFMHPSAHSTLLTLIYYIKKDGQVRIRETRNSRFFILK